MCLPILDLYVSHVMLKNCLLMNTIPFRAPIEDLPTYGSEECKPGYCPCRSNSRTLGVPRVPDLIPDLDIFTLFDVHLASI